MLQATPQDPSLKSLLTRRWRSMSLTFGLALTVGTALLSVLPKQYLASSKLLVMRSDQRLGGMRVVNDAIPELTGASNPLYTQIELLRSNPVIEDAIFRLNMHTQDGSLVPVEQIARHLDVTSIKGTDLIEVQYHASDPERAQRIVSAICESYLRATEQFRRDGVRDGLKFLDEQLERAKARLVQTETKLASYKRQSGAIALGDEVPTTVHELGDLDTSIRQRTLDFEAARARAASLQRQLGMSSQAALEAAAVAQSPRMRAIQDQLLAAETSPLRSDGLADDHPDLIALNHRVTQLQRQLKEETTSLTGHAHLQALDEVKQGLLQQLITAENDASAEAASLKAAEASRKQLIEQMAAIPGHELDLARLTQEVDVAREVYQGLLQKREEARLNLAIAPTYVRVVQRAEVPHQPDSPMRAQGLPVMILLSLAAAFGFGVLRDLLDRPKPSLELGAYVPELSIFATVPALSPQERRDHELVVKYGANEAYLEALRGLGLALEGHLDAPRGKVIALTSTMTGEGKSVTLANLALCLARAGNRVLLVDGDHRWPRVHELFGQPNAAQGLSDILIDGLLPSEAVLRLGEIDVVKAGSARLTSSVLRLKQQLKPTLDAWREQYDFVLLDLPPLLMFSEVTHFAKHADGVLLLANLLRVTPETLSMGMQQLQAVRIPLLGMVAISQGEAEPPAPLWGAVRGMIR